MPCRISPIQLSRTLARYVPSDRYSSVTIVVRTRGAGRRITRMAKDVIMREMGAGDGGYTAKTKIENSGAVCYCHTDDEHTEHNLGSQRPGQSRRAGHSRSGGGGSAHQPQRLHASQVPRSRRSRNAQPEHCHHSGQGLGSVRSMGRSPRRGDTGARRTRPPNPVLGAMTKWW